jgi:predicted nucleotide-binding protein (sugar kinase/HSP70/actin superfamily)
LDSGTGSGQKVDHYLPKIFANWSQLASKADMLAQEERLVAPQVTELTPAQPVISQSFMIDRKKLEEEIIHRELSRIREDFLKEARKIETHRFNILEAKMREKYDAEIQKKDDALSRASRVVNIQNALLSRVYESDKEILLKILQEADISEEDLRILSGTGEA